MAISLSEFFFPTGKPVASRRPPPDRAPSGFSESRFAQPGVGHRFGEAVGTYVVRGGPLGDLLDWAVGQVEDDIEGWVEGRVPVVEWRSPWKKIKRDFIKPAVKNLAWGIVKGAAAGTDRQAWQELMAVERFFAGLSEGDLRVWEGRLGRLQSLGEISLDDATKREVLSFLHKPQENFHLYQAFEQRAQRGAFDPRLYDELYRLVRAHEYRPIADDVLKREVAGIFERGKDIPAELFERLQNVSEQNLIDPDVFSFLRSKFERDQFFVGARDTLAWAHEIWTGRWKRQLWKRKISPWRKPLKEPYRAAARRLWRGVLAKTAAGKAVRGAAVAAKKALGAAAKAVAKAVVKVTAKLGLKTLWAAIHSAILSALGTAVPIAGNIAGAIAGPFAAEISWQAARVTCLGCGCATLFIIGFVATIFVTVGGAFHSSGTGGGTAAALVRVEKTANPHQVELVPTGTKNPTVEFTIKVHNLSEEEISGGKIVDDFDENNVTLDVLGGGTVEEDAGGNKKISWDIPSIPTGESRTAHYIAFVKANDGVDKVVINRVSFTGMLEGSPVSDSTLAFVIVGHPTGQYPSTWPLNAGCITQGPGGSDSHAPRGVVLEALDIAPSGGLEVYATHDGTAYLSYNSTYGNFVEVVSPLGFISRYAHLRPGLLVANEERVVPGQPLGFVYVGLTGDSTGTHLHYEFVGLTMEAPYIPEDVERGCVGRDGCNNFCFGG